MWLENAEAVATVDLANACYGLMLRLLGYCVRCSADGAEKSLAVDLAIGLMRRSCRSPSAPRGCLPGPPTRTATRACRSSRCATRVRCPRGRGAPPVHRSASQQLSEAGATLAAGGEARAGAAAAQLSKLAQRAAARLRAHRRRAAGRRGARAARGQRHRATGAVGERRRGDASRARSSSCIYEGRRCIHSRFCVTRAPQVFLANVQGPWIHPDAMPVERLVEVAHACPSGAIRYRRRDGQPQEGTPPVNLAAVREAGPYAFRAELQIDGEPAGFRATLCRCGASKNKPFCDGSHHEVGFSASGEPPSGKTDMLPVRDGVLAIDPQPNGPLQVRGNLEITSGTGRVVARVSTARLCRCGGSASKPFCDGTHARIGFKST